ncbi:MAG: choice-of-anchor D domain-containing protein [Patulibacter sp.]|nr:choice-of-anchor D domain-containing protein [Patulibacter sp.]
MHAPPTLRRRWLAVAVATAAAALPATATAAPAPQSEIDAAVASGVAWIADQQDKLGNGAPNPSPTGGLPGFNNDWAITTLAAGGIHAADVQKPGVPLSLQGYRQAMYLPGGSYDYLAALPGAGAAGNYGREALMATAAGLRVTKLDTNFNLTASLASKWRVAQGDFGAFAPNSDGFALLASPALHLPKGVRQKIVANLLSAQKTGTTPDAQGRTAVGGWSFSSSTTGAGDIDVTGAVLSMLCQEGMTPADPAVASGIDFLHRRLNPTTGGFGVAPENWIAENNTPSAAWAVIGLKACGVDVQGPEWTTPTEMNPITFLLGQQRTDPAVPGAVGSMRYVPTTTYPSGGQDMNATESGIRALSNSRWYSAPPERENPADPRWRTTPTVTDGTTVPVALSVDPGNGDVRFCAVQIPSGAPLTAVLETARTASVPSDCVSDWASDGAAITTINGETGTQWRVRFADGNPAVARDQAVGFGDVVALELVRELTTVESAVDFATQTLGTIGGTRTVSFTATADGTRTGRVALSGADVDDFLVGRNDCVDATLDAGQRCAVSVRFAPGATGARSAALTVEGPSGAAIAPTVALVGAGRERSTDAPVVPGPTIVVPRFVPVPAPPAGEDADPKPDKPERLACRVTGKKRNLRVVCADRRESARVTCRVGGKRDRRVTCTVRTKDGESSARARLTRKGRTYASGRLGNQRTTLKVRSSREVGRGRYTLRLGSGKRTTNFAIRIR